MKCTAKDIILYEGCDLLDDMIDLALVQKNRERFIMLTDIKLCKYDLPSIDSIEKELYSLVNIQEGCRCWLMVRDTKEPNNILVDVLDVKGDICACRIHTGEYNKISDNTVMPISKSNLFISNVYAVQIYNFIIRHKTAYKPIIFELYNHDLYTKDVIVEIKDCTMEHDNEIYQCFMTKNGSTTYAVSKNINNRSKV